jgi:hypothetical protein
MSVSININGTLILDQTTGLQGSDVDVTWDGTNLSGLDSDFMAFINALGLSDAQEQFAADVEGASRDDFVSVTADAGEVIGKLFFSDASGNDFDGDAAIFNGNPVQTIDGQDLFLYSEQNGHVVLLKTAGGEIAAAFYIEGSNGNLNATVQSITFIPLAHPDPNNPNDVIDFSDVLNVSAVISKPAPIGVGDDAPTIVTSGTEDNAVVDETDLTTNGTANFSTAFTPDFGTDGQGSGGIDYILDAVAGNSGLVDTASGENVILSKEGDAIVGRTETGLDLVFTVSIDQDGVVTVNQDRAVVHADPETQDEFVDLQDDLITVTATITDADGDSDDQTIGIGKNIQFYDDAPSIEVVGAPPSVTVDESNFANNDTVSFAGLFDGAEGNDTGGSSGIEYSLDIGAGGSGLIDTVSGETVTLAKEGDDIVARNASNDVVFVISVDLNGNVTLDQSRAVGHPDDADPNDIVQLASADLVTLTATITDGDGDHDDASIDIGKSFSFLDDGPIITVPSGAPDAANAAHLGNEAGQSVVVDSGYDLGADAHNADFYANGGSDFVDGLHLTGSVDGGPAFATSTVTATGEDELSATFDFSYTYDKDPITAGFQEGTAGGTVTIDKVNDTFEVTMTDPMEGFSFSVLHSNELLAKAPTGNTGHPEIVVTQLTPNNDPNPFFVQYTANTTTQSIGFGFDDNGEGAVTGGTAYNNGEMITNLHEDWVSATQTTNGVAGDTIQKGELLTLRFFGTNILSDVANNIEQLDPTTTADGIAIKFDGIGTTEDLMLVLNLIDANGVETTRAIRADALDIIKGNANVPFPYNTEFSLDNNDGLVILESNDYNLNGETFQIQGVQIMQSANGLTGTAINLDGAIGATGGSTASDLGVAFNTQAWDPTDNDVLKIVDIGFIQSSSGTVDGNLDFSYGVADADGDATAIQHVFVNVSNDFIV